MKTKTGFLILIVTLGCCLFSCDKSKKNDNSEATSKAAIAFQNFTKSFEGNISGDLGIIMTLTSSNNKLDGTYTYKTKGQPIRISGTIDEYGNLIINEYNDQGHITGVFKGQFSDESIKGHWFSPEGSKKTPFSITESKNSETDIMKSKAQKSEDDLQWTGIYFDSKGRSLKVTGPASDGAIEFELTPLINERCSESVWVGTAYLTNSQVANYHEEVGGCHFNFTFNSSGEHFRFSQIEVRESDCDHGVACMPFDGLYKQN